MSISELSLQANGLPGRECGVSIDVGKTLERRAHLMNVFDVSYNTFYIDGSESGAPYNIAGINRPRQWLVN